MQTFQKNLLPPWLWQLNESTWWWRLDFLLKHQYILNKVSHPRIKSYSRFFFCCGAATQCGSWPPHSWGFLDHTQRRTTVGRTPLDEWSARRRDLCLTTHNAHNRQISMPPVGFEPTTSAGERPQTYALDRPYSRSSCIPTFAETGTVPQIIPWLFPFRLFTIHNSLTILLISAVQFQLWPKPARKPSISTRQDVSNPCALVTTKCCDRTDSRSVKNGTVSPCFHSSKLKHCGRVTQICVFNTVKLGTSASSP